ncbi:hypothetical protein ACQFYA_01585 [Promicromonospora sp. Marseille-Q5078]
MTTVAQLRRAALARPETAESTRVGTVAFTVRGKGFASVTKDGVVRLHLAAEDVDAALAEVPGAEPSTRGDLVLGARLPLAALDGQQLNHWVRRAWFVRAPRRLAAAVASADAAAPGEVGDLPAAIGRPATRALAGAGLTTLAAVGDRSDAELLAMHGVGPRAVRILRETLHTR